MPRTEPHRSRAPSFLLIALGTLAVLTGLAADALGLGGSPGFGWKEWAAVAAGVVLLLAGLLLTPAARRSLAQGWAKGPPLRPGAGVVLALWFGLLTGVVEVAHQTLRTHLSDRLVPTPDEVIWMIPASHFVLFGAVGLLLALPLRPWRRLVTVPAGVFVLAFLGAWSQLLLHPQLDTVAVLVLAAGVAWQAARLGARHAAGLLAMSRRTTPWLAALVAVVAFGMPVVEGMGEQRRTASLPEPRQGAPNVLLIVLDTVRADHLGAYGYERPTSPNLDALGAEGVVFDWTLSTSCWTVPSHAALFTGRYTHQLVDEGWMGALDGRHPTLAEIFSEHGYATAGFVGNILYCCADRGFARGFTHYRDFPVTFDVAAIATGFGQALLDAGGHEPTIRNDAATVTGWFLSWLAEQDGSRPFFAFLNYFDPHALYLPPPGYDDVFGGRSPHLREWRSRATTVPGLEGAVKVFDAEQMAGFVRAYDGCIRFVDDHVRIVIDHLRATGALDNTLIVVVGDHGEHFGEHGLLSHANSLYSPLVRVPLLMSFPGRIPAGRRVTDLVSIRDVAATVLDLAQIRPAAPLPGQSLARLWGAGTSDGLPELSPALSDVRPAGGTAGKPKWWPISRGEMKSLAADGMHFILNGDGVGELYDLRADPNGLHDLIGTETGQRLEPWFRAELGKILGRGHD